MSYWVLFFIIGVVAFLRAPIIAYIIEKHTGEDSISLCFLFGGLSFVIIAFIGLCLQIRACNTYWADNYDLEAIYSEYESIPGCIYIKNTKEVDYYYSYTSENGVQINSSCVDNIIVEELIGGKKKVLYTTFVPSEKALSQKAEWEKFENFKL